ncbi:MAG: hypothetical protein SFV54_16265 [Bryobacteraceae bacterium]|nr:hypothetical protein [Bryobacteraceae bacterium]
MFPGADPGSLKRGNYEYLPVAPGRLEFAYEVRRRILAARPGVVAVELPEALESALLEALARLPEISVLVWEDPAEEDRAVYVPVEPCDPFTEAVRTALEVGAKVAFLEPLTGERPHLLDSYPDPYSIQRLGYERYVEQYRLHPQARTEEMEEHAAAMAWKLQGSDPLAQVMVVVSLNMLHALLDAMEKPQGEPVARGKRLEAQTVNAHPDCLNEITAEIPYLQWRYEQDRGELPDRVKVQYALLREAEAEYVKNTGQKIAHWQRRMMARYTRNLAQLDGLLVANLFDLTVAARSVVDDNYGWEVWAAAQRYPPQRAESDLETVNLSGDEVFLRTRKLRLRRRLPRPKQRLRPRGLKERKKEPRPGEWARELDGQSICSYPPEDLVIEEYGRFLKQKAKSLVSEERVRVEPFTTSIFDGVDLRETIRNWHEGRIYVRRFDRVQGEVGAVVVIFDDDRDERYNYTTTWLGESQNESDMAFYSTHPWDHLVGPGIGRAEYGGFLMALPARRMYDVWGDPDYEFAETKAERLLLAGLDYSVERLVVYVAAKPPRSIFRSVAAHLGRAILYVPIGALSPTKLKKLRVVHILDSYERREQAKDYLW